MGPGRVSGLVLWGFVVLFLVFAQKLCVWHGHSLSGCEGTRCAGSGLALTWLWVGVGLGLVWVVSVGV